MNKEDRKNGFKKFIDNTNTSQYDESVWTTLFTFESNTMTIRDTIILYLKILDANFESIPNLNKLDRLRLRQHIYLDIISKILILIESTMILVDSLTWPSYTHLLKNMTGYKFSYLYSIMDKIRNNSEYNVRRILGFYDICEMNILTKTEQKILSKIYLESQNVALLKLKALVDFYDDFRIIYGKTKHGLTIWSGFVPNNQFNLQEYFLICFDRKEYENEMPKNHITDTSNNTKKYYNVESYLIFNDKLKVRIDNILPELIEIINYICSNHLTYAINCGEMYLPYSTENGKTSIKFLSIPNLTTDEKNIFSNICEKVLKEMNTEIPNLIKSLKINKIKKILYEDAVANIFLKPI